jgi:S-adenosyl-L-methionine hydrolase (adenosine-forming)
MQGQGSPAPAGVMIITLVTDFGTRDYFVGSMKGVILGIHSEAVIVDISHEVTPHNILEASFLLKSSYRYFPMGTIHVLVVDPGVGSGRRPLAAMSGRYCFVAPDNGLLSWIFEEEPGLEVFEITDSRLFLEGVGSTFHGREVFAPVAAWLSKGTPIQELGRKISDPVRLAVPRAEFVGEREVRGTILYVDRFGNLITNIDSKTVPLLSEKELKIGIEVKGTMLRGLKTHYTEARGQGPSALVNSCGQLEIFCYEGIAAHEIGAREGDAVILRLT